MAGGANLLTFSEAARVFGVPVASLEQRFTTDRLPEAAPDPNGFGWLLPEDQLESIASREGWIIDLRDDPASSEQSPAFSEMLERLLEMGGELQTAVVAKERAEEKVIHLEKDLERNEQTIRSLESTIEEQDAENQRLSADLAEANTGRAVAEALAEERDAEIDQLLDANEDSEARHEQDLRRHRALESQLRKRLETTHNALGWLGRRRLERS